MQDAPTLEELPPEALFVSAVVAAASHEADEAQRALLADHPDAWQATLERLHLETCRQLWSLREQQFPEHDQVVADFEEEEARLAAALDRLLGTDDPDTLLSASEPAGKVRLQASWSAARLIVWGGGPGTTPASLDELNVLLKDAAAPTDGWVAHRPIPLPGATRAAAQAIPVADALGWLVSIATADRSGVDAAAGFGTSLRWVARVATWGVLMAARGSMVPTLRTRRRSGASAQPGRELTQLSVRWTPALVDNDQLAAMADAMPGPVTAVEAGEARAVVLMVLAAVVDAVATDAAGRLELPAAPPDPRTPAAIAETVLTRLDGSPFDVPARDAAELARRMDRWARPVSATTDARLVVQLDPPDQGNAWFLSVLGPDPDGKLVPAEVALVDSRSTRRVADELARLERLLPALQRPGGTRRGQVFLSQDEAWELMTVTGPVLESTGFDVRVPALSRRKPSAALRVMANPVDASVVGAHQLANVRWSAVFDDVELTAAEIMKLAAEARPLIRSQGRWVELDRADLSEAAAALAERANRTSMTGAELLRLSIGLEGSTLSGGVQVAGGGWAADLLAKAATTSTEPVGTPERFRGELRVYQSEALAWLRFLDSVELGGCLALDMGLGKTPTVLAHLVRAEAPGATLVIAPPAVVGNWAAEAARFTPSLRVVVHHGASRASAAALAREVAGADIVITTYGTAVRDIDALAEQPWARMVLDEAQAIKNPASETAQQLRRIPATRRLVLTGTPIENGLGDLWALLDFTNPGLVGPRSTFVTQLSANGETSRQGGEQALRALNGILTFRRTKTEPVVAAELPERIDQLDHCTMTPEQIGLYQAVLDKLVVETAASEGAEPKKGAILAAITALKQICNHPAAYEDDGRALAGRSGKLARLEEIVDAVFAADEKVLVFTHFAEWGKRLADHLTARTGQPIHCYHGGLARGARDKLIADFQGTDGAGALVLSLKAGGTGLNLTAASHVVLYDRWWNPAVEDQARDRAWRIGQTRTVVSHRLVCPGTVDERVEEVVAGKRHIAELVLPKSSSLADLDTNQLRVALGLAPEALLEDGSEAAA